MLGRPPAVLALHLNRSVHTGLRVAKNGARVAFPELLDLAPYTTSGVLNLDPTAALSGSDVAFPSRANAHVERREGEGEGSEGAKCLYRLAAVVCHYGQHSFGHYICYRRAPVRVPPLKALPPSSATHPPTSALSPPPPTSAPSPSPPTYAPAPPNPEGSAGTGTGWLRISDARVERCGVEEVLAEGSAAFMLYYERVPEPRPPSPSPLTTTSTSTSTNNRIAAAASTGTSSSTLEVGPDVYAGDSAETIRPAHVDGGVGWAGVGRAMSMGPRSSGIGIGPRVVRSVSLGLGASSRASLSSSSSASSSTLSLQSISSVSVSGSSEEERMRSRRRKSQSQRRREGRRRTF
ncbi:hypothetical protein B0H12DRAFT_754118 [Mycena haematopus]|nr:hypothetical protein B0H12DRAFT_754118 [Mycena haematopus]